MRGITMPATEKDVQEQLARKPVVLVPIPGSCGRNRNEIDHSIHGSNRLKKPARIFKP
jgi:hypothetical protein